jgi:aryl-alcohol dehydrogenase-like predicted oxidoreductase
MLTVPTRQLGPGLETPVIGLGVSGPHGGQATRPALTAALVDQMIAAGAPLFDSAPFYGDAEARLGQALAGRAGVVITKVGKRRLGARLIADFSPAAMDQSLRDSLARLGRRSVAVVLLHGPPPELARDGAVIDWLKRVRGEGLAQLVGVAGRGEELAAFAETGAIQVLQAPVWPVAVRPGMAARDWPAYAASRGLGFIGIEAVRPARPDLRAPRSLADLWYIARGLKNRDLRTAGGDVGAALRAALARPGVSCVIFTTTRPEHLRANLAAITQP